MGKIQTQGKVSKVGDTFGLIWLLFWQGKVGVLFRAGNVGKIEK